jgi:hypothetical protein
MDASYEKLGSFYLGKKFDLAAGEVRPDLVCYDAKDLTTHAMCVGMTGSGKTGLCLALLEEAAIDGIPVIAIDPKGDLGNLLLAFPELKPSDFRPWIDESEAARQGIDPEALATQTANVWRSGLAQWDEQPERIAKFRDSVDIAIYTPGSNTGLPLTVLRSFDAPPPEIIADAELFRERISGAASALLALLGIDADPLTSPAHILLSTILSDAWSQGQNLELGSLIRLIQNPPVSKIGVFEIESFMPTAERTKLAMSLNNLLASPSFAGWLEGQRLDIRSLLYTDSGKPRISILSIAHLSDAERMFFVTIFLDELLSWVRTQPGTSSLRALFYMDEIYGYFPPSAKPPSKPPMMLLLKQARAFGLGIVLATQNPADLDYKGLANIGTWFLGRLQTERDKARVLEGLEGASAQAGLQFDRATIDKMLSALTSRVFLMNNVHDDGPTLFKSRWALSYLRGPLGRNEIQRLMDPRRPRAAQSADAEPAAPAARSDQNAARVAAPAAGRPLVPPGIEERFARPARGLRIDGACVYRPALLGTAACHYVRAAADVDVWTDTSWLVLDGAQAVDELPWTAAIKLAPDRLELDTEPDSAVAFDDLPTPFLVARNYKRWQTQLKDYLYRHQPLRLFQCPELKSFSRPGLDELDARLGFEQSLREARDAAKEKLQAKVATALRSLDAKIQTAQQRVEREGGQFYESALDLGQTVLGMLLGNRRSRVAKTSATVRGLGKAARQRGQSQTAQEALESLLAERAQLIEDAEKELQALKDRYSLHAIELAPLDVPCRKSDTRVDLVALVWLPWSVGSDSQARPLLELPQAQ